MLSTNFGGYKSTVSLTTIATLSVIFSNSNAQAQIVSDGTTNTQVKVIEGTSFIEGGIVNGQNLFHSFKQFSLPTYTVANFALDLEVQNIFSRVTGGLVSNIDGLIKTQGNANLFLLNPAGVIFGANAQLDVGGSFVVSSGDRFTFADGTEFGTNDLEKASLLTVSAPIGLQYGADSGKIVVLPNTERLSSNSSGLNIKPGNTLALLGGDVSITRNSINGVESNIEIGSVQSGSIHLTTHDNGWQFNYDNAPKLGKINLTNGALVINNSGVVNFKGKTINLLAGSGIVNFTNIDEAGSVINLEATESIDLNGGSLLSQVWQQRSNTEQNNTGAGGDILLKAPHISFRNGSLISAATLSEEEGGSITINAGEILELNSDTGQNPTIVSTSTEGLGNGGDIQVNTANLIIKDGSQIQAFGREGSGGTITVNANESLNISGMGILRSQDTITGDLSETSLNSGFFASSGIEGVPPKLQAQGDSGSLIINTPSLNIEDSGQISVSNFGLGDGGDIQIQTSNLDLDTKGQIVANTVSGKGGSINLFAQESIMLDNQSSIATTAKNNGDGGKINVETNNLVLLKSNRISADAQQGSGGKIKVNTQVFLADADSSITANSEVNQKKGVVEIETLDLNSRLQTEDKEQSPLAAEKSIQKRCGVGGDFSKNQFRNIGRGGISSNPMQETTSVETLEDLSASEPDIAKNATRNHRKIFVNKDSQPITEAQTWIVNSQGNVELVASTSAISTKQASICRNKQ